MRLHYFLLAVALSSLACSLEPPAADDAAASSDALSGSWLVRSAVDGNDCPELGSFAPFDLKPVRFAAEQDTLSVTQDGTTVRYSDRASDGWRRAVTGEWAGCPISAQATLRLRALSAKRFAGRYEATYTTEDAAACAGLPARCTVSHQLLGVRP